MTGPATDEEVAELKAKLLQAEHDAEVDRIRRQEIEQRRERIQRKLEI